MNKTKKGVGGMQFPPNCLRGIMPTSRNQVIKYLLLLRKNVMRSSNVIFNENTPRHKNGTWYKEASYIVGSNIEASNIVASNIIASNIVASNIVVSNILGLKTV